MYGFVVRHRGLLLLITASAVIRLIAVGVWAPSLTDDRDAYLALAEQLRSGAGYVNPYTLRPTAFRPPLLPIVLAGLTTLFPAAVAVAVLHITLGTLTVVLTWVISRQLGFQRLAWCAAAWVSLDPLLVRYTAWPMTESLAAFLLCAATALSFSERTDAKTRMLTGVTLGLAVLCRPSFWIVAVILCGTEWLTSMSRSSWTARLKSAPWITLAGLALTVTPWLTRNLVTLRAPVVTTTHGGYTLLLGNNPRFIDEVVQRPWGAVWGRKSLDDWQTELNRQLAVDGVPDSEVDRDRWMYRRAFDWIAAHPQLFRQAIGLRFRRFWSLWPAGSAADDIPRPILGCVAGFYGLMFLLAAAGVCRIRSDNRVRWLALVTIIASLCLVHCVFWSNTRFRGPVTPLIAILATAGLGGTSSSKTAPHTKS